MSAAGLGPTAKRCAELPRRASRRCDGLQLFLTDLTPAKHLQNLTVAVMQKPGTQYACLPIRANDGDLVIQELNILLWSAKSIEKGQILPKYECFR